MLPLIVLTVTKSNSLRLSLNYDMLSPSTMLIVPNSNSVSRTTTCTCATLYSFPTRTYLGLVRLSSIIRTCTYYTDLK
jgi:hypothetical protein